MYFLQTQDANYCFIAYINLLTMFYKPRLVTKKLTLLWIADHVYEWLLQYKIQFTTFDTTMYICISYNMLLTVWFLHTGHEQNCPLLSWKNLKLFICATFEEVDQNSV